MSVQSDKKIEKAHKLDKIDYEIICQLLWVLIVKVYLQYYT
jgi:hypothetical protein